ncbi:MAG: iron ABC transporter permease [Desulfitobacterium sp.]|nr:iron ABC transporter permease [Desulfitobacterium sp.]
MAVARKRGRFWTVMAILAIALIILFFASFLIGRYPIAPAAVWDIICSHFINIPVYWDATMEQVVLQVRLPRILLGILVGGALSISGASYQTLFKNPMASPDLLGVSAGAGFGASLVMLDGGTWWQIQSSAFLFGIIAVLAAWLISRVFGGQNITVLVLAGIVVSSFFQSLLSIVKTLADTDDALPSITFWLMGSLGRANADDVLVMLPATVISLALLFFFRYQIDTLAAGEAEAASMGVNVPLVKVVVIVSSTLLTVSAVSICGIIGWIGMVVPHIARLLVGASYTKLAAASFLVGGLFLLIIDNVIRAIGVGTLPLGVLTSLIGTPVFVVLLSKARKAWL